MVDVWKKDAIIICRKTSGGTKMFREMRRKNQQMNNEEGIAVLKRATSGVLAVSGDDGYPYAVPLSYVYNEGKLYFHCAAEGHKLEAVRRCDKVSFCVIDQDEVVPEKYTTFYRSVIVFGRMHLVDDVEEMRRIAAMLAMKYSADFKDGIPEEINSSIRNMAILELTIDHITAKEAIELIKQRNAKSGISQC